LQKRKKAYLRHLKKLKPSFGRLTGATREREREREREKRVFFVSLEFKATKRESLMLNSVHFVERERVFFVSLEFKATKRESLMLNSVHFVYELAALYVLVELIIYKYACALC
jgi:hypothetical protein